MAEKPINKALIQLSTSGISSAYPMTLAVGVKEAHGGSGLTDVLDDIYAQLGTGGTVEQKIQDAIEKLDADVTSTTGNHVTVQVVEVDGMLTEVTVTEDIEDTIDGKIADLDATVGDTTVATGKHVAVQVVETDGKLTNVTVTENDIASAALLGTTGDTEDDDTAFGKIAAEEARATGEEAELATAIADEEARATEAEEALEDLIETLSGNAVTSVNGHTGNTVVVDGGDIKLDGYTIAATATPISSADTVNVALGKLERGLEDAVAGGVSSVVKGDGISVDSTDKNNPVVSAVVDDTADNGVALTLGSTKGIGVTVDAVEDANGIVTGATNVVTAGAVAEKIASLDKEDTAVATKYVSSVSEADGIITVGRTNLVNANDKVLATNDTGNLTSTLDLTYDSSAKTITLAGIGGAEIAKIDATDFVKDGMLESVTLVEIDSKTYIHFVWNTDAGKTELDLDVTKLIDTYTAGDGLALDDHKFSVNVNETDNEFLEVTSAGVRVTGVSAAISAAVESLDVTETIVTATKESSSTDVAAEFKYSETNGKVSITNFKLTNVASKTDLEAEVYAREEGDEATLASAKTYTNEAISGVVSGLDATVSATSEGIGAISITITEKDGKLDTVSMTEQVAGKSGDVYKGGVMSAAQAEKLDNSIMYEVVEELD